VRSLLSAREKMWQNWQSSEQTLLKKRETITRVRQPHQTPYAYLTTKTNSKIYFFSFKQQDEQKKYPVLNLRSKVSHLKKKDENVKILLDWEGRVQQNRKAFEEMSATAKSEINIWEGERVRDTKAFMTNWMKDMLEAERKIVKMWEQYLPKA